MSKLLKMVPRIVHKQYTLHNANCLIPHYKEVRALLAADTSLCSRCNAKKLLIYEFVDRQHDVLFSFRLTWHVWCVCHDFISFKRSVLCSSIIFFYIINAKRIHNVMIPVTDFQSKSDAVVISVVTSPRNQPLNC